uniref:RE58095p n=1 Tax=Drosophila melanogaster TaxID=7227 RepID=Q8SYH5_DROME|nr:RE58095p [Drosophila melanogaster]
MQQQDQVSRPALYRKRRRERERAREGECPCGRREDAS